MNLKTLRAGCASRGVEVSCKQHRSSAKESQATLCSFKVCKRLQENKNNWKIMNKNIHKKRNKQWKKDSVYVFAKTEKQ